MVLMKQAKCMKLNKILSIIAALTMILLFTGCTQKLPKPSVERGEYLVRGPAACGSCHTPMGPLTKNKNDRRVGPIPGMELAGKCRTGTFRSNLVY